MATRGSVDTLSLRTARLKRATVRHSFCHFKPPTGGPPSAAALAFPCTTVFHRDKVEWTCRPPRRWGWGGCGSDGEEEGWSESVNTEIEKEREDEQPSLLFSFLTLLREFSQEGHISADDTLVKMKAPQRFSRCYRHRLLMGPRNKTKTPQPVQFSGPSIPVKTLRQARFLHPRTPPSRLFAAPLRSLST